MGLGDFLFGSDDKIEVPTRNIGQEARQTVGAQLAVMPDLISGEAQYRPQFADMQVDQYGRVLNRLSPMLTGAMPGMETANLAANRMATTGALETAGAAAPQYRSVDAQLNPELMRLFGESERIGLSGSGQLSGAQQQLQDEFFSRIGQGLTDAEERDLTQAVRAGANDRGMFRGNRALLDESTRLTEANEQRRARNNQMASAFLGGRLAQVDNLTSNRMQRAVNPYNVLQQSRLGLDSGQVLNLANVSANARPQLFDPFNAYAQDIYSSNQNAKAAEAAANAEQDGGLFGNLATGFAGGFAGSAGRALGAGLF